MYASITPTIPSNELIQELSQFQHVEVDQQNFPQALGIIFRIDLVTNGVFQRARKLPSGDKSEISFEDIDLYYYEKSESLRFNEDRKIILALDEMRKASSSQTFKALMDFWLDGENILGTVKITDKNLSFSNFLTVDTASPSAREASGSESGLAVVDPTAKHVEGLGDPRESEQVLELAPVFEQIPEIIWVADEHHQEVEARGEDLDRALFVRSMAELKGVMPYQLNLEQAMLSLAYLLMIKSYVPAQNYITYLHSKKDLDIYWFFADLLQSGLYFRHCFANYDSHPIRVDVRYLFFLSFLQKMKIDIPSVMAEGVVLTQRLAFHLSQKDKELEDNESIRMEVERCIESISAEEYNLDLTHYVAAIRSLLPARQNATAVVAYESSYSRGLVKMHHENLSQLIEVPIIHELESEKPNLNRVVKYFFSLPQETQEQHPEILTIATALRQLNMALQSDGWSLATGMITLWNLLEEHKVSPLKYRFNGLVSRFLVALSCSHQNFLLRKIARDIIDYERPDKIREARVHFLSEEARLPVHEFADLRMSDVNNYEKVVISSFNINWREARKVTQKYKTIFHFSSPTANAVNGVWQGHNGSDKKAEGEPNWTLDLEHEHKQIPDHLHIPLSDDLLFSIINLEAVGAENNPHRVRHLLELAQTDNPLESGVAYYHLSAGRKFDHFHQLYLLMRAALQLRQHCVELAVHMPDTDSEKHYIENGVSTVLRAIDNLDELSNFEGYAYSGFIGRSAAMTRLTTLIRYISSSDNPEVVKLGFEFLDRFSSVEISRFYQQRIEQQVDPRLGSSQKWVQYVFMIAIAAYGMGEIGQITAKEKYSDSLTVNRYSIESLPALCILFDFINIHIKHPNQREKLEGILEYLFTQYLKIGLTNYFYSAESGRTNAKIWSAFMQNLDRRSKLYFIANLYDCFCQLKTGEELDKSQQEFLIQWAEDQGYDRYKRPIGWFRNQFSSYLKDQIYNKRGLCTPERQMQLAMVLSVLSQGVLPKLASIIWYLSSVNETELALVSLNLLKFVGKKGLMTSSTASAADTCLLHIVFFEFCIARRNLAVGPHFASNILKLIETDKTLRDEFKDLMRTQHPACEFKFKNLISDIKSTIKSEKAQVFEFQSVISFAEGEVDQGRGEARSALGIMRFFGAASHKPSQDGLAAPLLAAEESDMAVGSVEEARVGVAVTQL